MNFSMFLEMHARGTPDKTALVDGDRVFTFRELDGLANAFANYLTGTGVRGDARVAIHGPNSAESVVCILGSLKAGVVVVPINWRLRGPDLARVLDHCGPAVFLTAAGRDEVLGVLAKCGTVLSLGGDPAFDSFSAAMGRQSKSFSLVGVLNDHVANLLYTSGTSGIPKAVIQTHGVRLAHAAAQVDTFKLSSADVGLAVSPLFHASGLGVLFSSILVGATVVIMPRWDVALFVDVARRHQVTFMHLITTMVVDLLQAPKHFFLPPLSSIRITYGGGHAVGPEVIEAYEKRVGGVFSEGYGRTEGGFTYNPSTRNFRRIGSHGYANRNAYELSIVDTITRSAVAPGTTGEIIVRGDGVSPGYWDGAFIRSPRLLDGGWHPTGDRGFLDEDGYLWFSGRVDQMIKTGGENVYPAEVTDVLLAMPGVADAVVVGVPDVRLGQKIAALVVVSDKAITAAAIEARCRQELAGFKIPRLVLFVEELPRLSNQKVDYDCCLKLLLQNHT